MPVDRRQFLALSSAALAAWPSRRAFTGQQAPATPPVTRFETVRDNFQYFLGRGGTIGILSNADVLLVVDTQYPVTAKICLDALRTRSTRDVDLVINTHHHADHTAGNSVFRPVVKKIVAQQRVPDLQRQAVTAATTDPQVYADTLFEKTWSMSAGDEDVSATFYGPAHTGGDAIVHFKNARIVHMGDLLLHQMHPFVDRPGGGSVRNWMKSLDTIAKEMPADVIYVAGHAKTGVPVTADRAALLRQRDYFDAVLTHVTQGIARHASRDEITGLAALPGFEDLQSVPPRFTLAFTLGVAYDELTQ